MAEDVRDIPPHTPPAVHVLTTRRSAEGGEGANPHKKIASHSDTIFIQDFPQKKFELRSKIHTISQKT